MPFKQSLIFHKGVYRKTATTLEAVFLITGITIGAGILGLPYAVAQAGLGIGVVSIIVVGVVLLLLNLMIGEIASRTKEPLQLPGLAKKYVGAWAGYVLSTIVIFSTYGILLAYMVGQGQSLQSLFGGNEFWWGIGFWVVMSVVVWRGLSMAKEVQKILSVIVLLLLLGICSYLLPHVQFVQVAYNDFSKVFLPYGVILFALYGVPAIAEAHALLPDRPLQFRRALVIGTLIPIFVALLFVIAVVGVEGKNTLEVATLGLGRKFGPILLLLGNLVAVFAMGTGFVGIGIALKQTFVWDDKIKPTLATILVISVPLILYGFGLRNFVSILDVVGGVFLGIQTIIMVLVYWQAKQKGVLRPSPYNLHHVWLFIIPVLVVFILMTWYKLFSFIM
jgi:tyrosine-specific transport protein